MSVTSNADLDTPAQIDTMCNFIDIKFKDRQNAISSSRSEEARGTVTK